MRALDVSVVIPARNEELEIGRCLAAANHALTECGVAGEIIVVDDGSDDRTADIAREAGANVVSVELHNIGAVRNAGAAAATGEVIVFVDADTQLPGETLQAALDAIRNGAVGGGGGIEWDSPPPFFSRICSHIFLFFWQTWKQYACGCFIFCRRSEFEAIGGFDPAWFAAEERELTIAMRRRGPFVILKQNVISSARKMRLYTTGELIRIAIPALFFGRGRLQQRRGLELLYDAPRESADGVAPETTNPAPEVTG